MIRIPEKVINRADIYLVWETGQRTDIAELTLTMEQGPQVTIKGLKRLRFRMGWELFKMGFRFMIGRGKTNDDPQ